MAYIVVIGSGFSGLSAAAYLSRQGHDVHVFEKNTSVGGRARQLKTENGYLFDMGPSWYWMPDVFEKFFNDFGYTTADFYHLKLLDPSFDVVFGKNETIGIPENYDQLRALFESIETGSSLQLDKFMLEAEFKYKTGMENLVYKPGLSISEFVDMDLLKGSLRLQVFSSFSKHVRKYFTHPKLIAIMEFPVLFLGAMPQETPALYSLMNYAGLKLGTWYPEGGFSKVIDAIVSIAGKYGTTFHTQSPVEQILVNDNKVSGVVVGGKAFSCDAVIASADYHHVENRLLPVKYRNYNETYWNKKTFAPSCLIYYLGITKRIKTLNHHTLFFDENMDDHSKQIYKDPQWPTKPLFYVSCTSKSDPATAPSGHENLFLLMPLAVGLTDTEELREKYFNIMLNRLEVQTGENIRSCIDFKKSYCINDFITDYNAFKGNAYGLANTLMQTAILKPKMKNSRLKNLFYTGQLTVPGPGVPPSVISGKIVAGLLNESFKQKANEITI